MKMMSLVAPIEEMHGVLEELVILSGVHTQNYTINGSSDSLTMQLISDYINDNLELGIVQKLKFEKPDFRDLYEKIGFIADSINLDLKVDKNIDRDYDFNKIVARLETMFKVMAPIKNKMDNLLKEIQEKEDFLSSITFLESADIEIAQIREMKFINYHIGTLTKENRIKLRDNYENISAIVLHIGSSPDGESYLIFSPSRYEEETQKVLKSLNFKEIKIPEEAQGNVSQVSTGVKLQIEKIKRVHEEYKEVIRNINESYTDEITKMYSEIHLEEKIYILKENVAVTNNFFVFSGWVPEGQIEEIEKTVSNYYSGTIIETVGAEEIPKEIVPPTKLKNNWMISPFELLVNMYGIPNYKEIDPTLFLGITYLILFGAMFGDVGQGMVFVLAGLWIKRKNRKGTEIHSYGDILSRLGISSTIFGFVYGSVFGDEELIEALIVRPLDNINFVLMTAVAFGVTLLLCGYIISLINLKRENNKEELLFGRNGLAGLLLYVGLLILVLQIAISQVIIPNIVLGIVIVIALGGMLFKKQLYSLISKEEPEYEEGKASYYIEGGFDLLETIMSLLSNSISFIRIGAFALNHVGLFLAFATMASLVNNNIASFAILLMGNIIIIFLEGLIVFIQGLRLEYYELFSKYYTGDGKEYKPIKFIDDVEVI